MNILQREADRVVVSMSEAEFWQLKHRGDAKPLEALLAFLETAPPEAEEALRNMPEDARRVVEEFRKDYLAALGNFKEALVSTFSWAMHARDQLQLLHSYLKAEEMAGKLGVREKADGIL